MEEKEKINNEEEIKDVEVVDVVPKEKTTNINQNTNPNVEDKSNSKGLSIASMVLGIVALCLLKTGLVSMVCAILAIVFGVKGQKRAGKKQAKAGFIMGIVALSLLALGFILVTIIGVGLGMAIFSAAL